MNKLKRAVVAVAGVGISGAIVALIATSGSRGPSPEQRAIAASLRFLDGYMDHSGRVVRRDQGGDTVSEGQAYAMLVAAALGDGNRFAELWEWTRSNLQRADGLLAWQWADGQIADEQPASDADILAAWALLVAADRFDDDGYAKEANRIADAILAHEAVRAGDSLVLVAGPWAQAGPTHTVNPSYSAPSAFDALEAETGDPRWRLLAQSTYEMMVDLTAGAPLPPDWASISTSGRLTPAGRPDDSAGRPAFGLDAMRAFVWLATSCDESGRDLAASAWKFFAPKVDTGIALAYDLDGTELTQDQHPLGWIAAAATAKAAGSDKMDALLARAESVQRDYPTYYGSAWLALGRTLLTTDLLHRC